MYFNFRSFFRIAYLSFFKWKSAPVTLTPRRFLFLITFFLLFPVVQLFNAFCLLLDELIFPAYRSMDLDKPIFIVGNPRSGTTFIHRIMAKDEKHLFCFRTWEIVFPSIVQKKVLSMIARIDRMLGSKLVNGIKRIEYSLFDDFSRMHRISLFVPEEDDKLLIHSFAHMDLMWFFPFVNEFEWMGQLDQFADPEDRKRIMRFYKKCIKRQAYIKGRKKHFLSKSPFGSGRVGSLQKFFPGCKIIYAVRNPLEVIPSMIHMAEEIWNATANFSANREFQKKMYDMLKYYYTYPLKRLEEGSQNDFMIIKYDDAVNYPLRTIQMAYQKFGLSLGPDFLNILKHEEQKAKAYSSHHKYTIDEILLTRQQIIADMAEIFDRFGFDASL